MKKGNLIGLGVLVLIFGGIGIVLLVQKITRDRAVAPFEPHIGTYASMNSSQPESGTPTRTGKVIPIDLDKKEVDRPVYFDMPDNLKPKTPEEVGTVAHVQWARVEIGKYDNGKTAYRWDARVSVFDLASKKTVHRFTVEGDDPPERIKSSESGEGPKPSKKIIAVLSSMVTK